jgi:hypothetical protein
VSIPRGVRLRIPSSWSGSAVRRTSRFTPGSGPSHADSPPLDFKCIPKRPRSRASTATRPPIAPTGQFVLVVLVYGEELTDVHLQGFGCIWAAVAVFTVDGWWASRRNGRACRTSPGGLGTSEMPSEAARRESVDMVGHQAGANIRPR